MGIYTEAVQKLYVAYFSRPADAAGLTYWEGVVTAAGGSTAAVSAAFAASAEYKAAYAGLDAYATVNQVYLNLFGRPAEPAGLQFWGQNLLNGKITIDGVVTAVAGGAQGSDAIAYNSKVAAATAFTASLDTSAEILGYSGPEANALAANFIAGITDAATLAAAVVPATLAATVLAVTTPPVIGVTTTLTVGVDSFIGTAGNDTIIATTAAGENALTTFDTVNGGAGNDTLVFVDTKTAENLTLSLPTDATVSGIETVTVKTTGGVDMDTTILAGVTKLAVSAAGSALVNVVAADTTDVSVTSATTTTVDVAGGKAVAVVAAGATAITVEGEALTTVAVTGGTSVLVNNFGDAAGEGTTLTAATVTGVKGNADLWGANLTTVSLGKIQVASTVTVHNATEDHTLNLNLAGVGYDTATPAAVVAVNVVDAEAVAVNIATSSKSAITLGSALVETATLTGAGALRLDATGAAALEVVAGAAATGAITLTNLSNIVNTVSTGSGADTVTLTSVTVKDNADTAATNETVNATVSTGAGNDKITLAVSGSGKVTVDAGDGNDSITILSRGASDSLVLSLGAGSDTVTASPLAAIGANDIINAGDGVDTLTLSLVGSANIKAFSGFELFDAKALAKTLDVDILASQNTVTEIIASGNVGVGGATLVNVGGGVNFRATGEMGVDYLTLTQKVNGAITLTVDIDEKGDADTGIETASASVAVNTATTTNIVFASDYLAKIDGETAAGDNVTTFNVKAGVAAAAAVVGVSAAVTAAGPTAATVESGGTLSKNVLNYMDLGNKLGTLTVTGAQALNLTITGTATATVDASASTGGLTMSTASLKDLGNVKLGTGVDVITVAATSTSAAFESITGMEKAAAASIGADATAAAAAVADADTIILGGAVAGEVAVAGGAVNTKGVLTFTGAGPATLAAAFAIADLAADAAGEVLVFNYLNDSYVFQDGGTAVKLVGVTGITNLVEAGDTGAFFVV